MLEHIDLLFYKLRYLTYGLLMIAGLLMFSLLISVVNGNHRQAGNASTPASIFSTSMSDSPNVVTNAMGATVTGLGQAANSIDDAITNVSASIARAVTHSGTFATDSGKAIGHGVLTGVAFVARGIGGSIAFMGQAAGTGFAFLIHIPLSMLGYVSHTAVVSAAIKPTDNTPVPVIGTPPAATVAKSAAVVPAKPVAQITPQPASPAIPSSPAPAWPIHGTITTYFGVPEWPYEAIHTGLDISDGRPAGVTPVKAFKPGRVIQTIRTPYSGLGNHVIVDHGGGLTSVYGHLSSISVQVGQTVDNSTTLGFEGSTGVSTGTHLHFEIRVNGTPVNPLQYISGRP